MLDLFQSFTVKNRFGNNGFRGYLEGKHCKGRVLQIINKFSSAGKAQRKKRRKISQKDRRINRT